MRIAILTNNFPPIVDGVGDYSYNLANELQKNGHVVCVICRTERSIEQTAQGNRFDIPVFANVPSWNWRAVRPLLNFITERKPDWLLVQYVPNSFQRWAMPIWLPILIWLAKQHGVLIGITFHEVSIRPRGWPLKYSIVSVIQRFIAFLLAQLADKLVTSIDYYTRQLQEYTNKPIHLIPIGSNIIPIIITGQERTLIRQQLITNAGPVVSTFGVRNQDLLIQITELLVEQIPNLNVLIIGKLCVSKPILPLYQKLQERIHITGYLAEADVYRHLVISDVFFIPDPVTINGEGGSSNKSTSLAAGLAAGLPIVGTLGDMNNTLLSQIPGLHLEDAANLPKLVQRLCMLITNRNQTRNRQLILPFFNQTLSWSAIVSQYTRVFGWT